MRITKKPTLFKKLFFWFVWTVVLPLGISGYVNYRNYKNVLEKVVTDKLFIIADSKILEIEHFIRERERDAIALAGNPFIISTVEECNRLLKKGIDASAREVLDKEIRPFLSYYQKLFRFYNLLLISSEGDIIFNALKEADDGMNLITGSYKYTELAKSFIIVRNDLKTAISDFRYYPLSQAPAVFIVAPVVKNGTMIGAIAFQVETQEIYKLTSNYVGLGETGEILLALKIGNDAVFANPLRHDPYAAFSKKIEIGSPLAFPVQQAVQGINNSGLSTDYRGEDIVAVWRYLPSPRWGMVAKIDTKEAFAPIRAIRNWSLFICIMTSSAGLLAALLVSKSIANPIKQLQNGAEIIGKGNLDYKVGISSDDEIGQLSKAFDAMTKNLKEITASRDELNKITVELARSNKELQQFAYVASHDLQEPLRMVASFTSLLERRYKDKLDQDAQEFIRYAVDGALRMQQLIDDLLNYSRVGTQNIPFGPTDCNHLLDEAITNLRVAIEESHAVITSSDLPTVTCNGSQVIQLFQNLLSNAIKFRSRETPRIHVSAETREDEWLFSFQDNGIGIDPRYKDRIFNIFQRLHSRDEYAGTGIGLALCMKIVELHNGKMWTQSELGKGATFYFTIPA